MKRTIITSVLLTALTVSTQLGTSLYAQEHNSGRYGIDLSIAPLSSVNIGPLKNLTGSEGHVNKNYISGLVRGTYHHTER